MMSYYGSLHFCLFKLHVVNIVLLTTGFALKQTNREQ